MKYSAFDGNETSLTALLGNYLSKLPKEARITKINEELGSLWEKIKEKLDYGEAKLIKEEVIKHIYSDNRRFEKFINGSRSPTLLFINRFNEVSKRIIGEEIDYKVVISKPLKFGDGGNAASAVLPIKISSSLCYLIGAMRDGTLSMNGKYEISFAQKNIEWLDLIKNLMGEVFNPSNTPRIVYRKNTSPKLTISNRPIFEFLNKICGIPIGKKISWSTSSIIKEAPSKLQKYYIRGFFDADGLSDKLGFCQVNRSALVWVKNKLAEYGINSGKLIKRVREDRDYPVHYFYISKKSYDKFINVIGCSNGAKGKNFSSIQNKTSQSQMASLKSNLQDVAQIKIGSYR